MVTWAIKAYYSFSLIYKILTDVQENLITNK